MKNKLWIKIFVPVLIVALIGGLWLFKSSTETEATKPSNNPAGGTTAAPGDPLAGADFSLAVTQ